MDLYEEITKKILSEMEKGIIPWHKPWTCSNGAVSHQTGRPYSVLNQYLLAIGNECIENGEYVTFNQVKSEGGNVKKGEKGNMVVFWKILHKKIVNEDGTEEEKDIPYLRYYHVWEVSQCEGIKRKYEAGKRVIPNPLEEGEKIVNDYFDRESCRLKVSETDKACYIPSRDKVCVPRIQQYDCANEYYSTLFHEMIHSTGHESRLNRLTQTSFGSSEYSKEELVAEIGSTFLCGTAGIETNHTLRNSVAYLQSWMRALKNDKSLFVSAAGNAEKAANYVLQGKCINACSLAFLDVPQVV
ncbi:MAG: DUF1738 domain-containing protein [Bacteroidales bacterium]|nr:DUF1738 domain-containing protein [Candidatus Colimorpha merdihippi]